MPWKQKECSGVAGGTIKGTYTRLLLSDSRPPGCTACGMLRYSNSLWTL